MINKYLKNPLWQIVALLIILFIYLGLISFLPDIKWGKTELKKAEIKEMFEPSADIKVDKIIPPQTLIDNPNKQEATDTSKQRILWIGDSMLEKLMQPAQEYADANGHKLFPVVWYSSSTLWYGQSDTIRFFIKKFKPTYVFIVLGANELFIRDIFKKRHKYVKRILEQIDTLRYVWIGPPNWKDDTGINDMIKTFVPDNQFFESRNLTLDRISDGAHPTKAAAKIWMDSIARWVMHDSRYPILLNKPDKKIKSRPHATLLQPMY